MAKKKINDDTLLQLIRDGNSPAEAARRLGVGRAVRHWPALGLTTSACHYRNTQKVVRCRYLKLLAQQIHLGAGFLPFAVTNGCPTPKRLCRAKRFFTMYYISVRAGTLSVIHRLCAFTPPLFRLPHSRLPAPRSPPPASRSPSRSDNLVIPLTGFSRKRTKRSYFSLSTVHCSLFTALCASVVRWFPAPPRVAIEPRGVIFRCPLFTVHSSPPSAPLRRYGFPLPAPCRELNH